MKKLERFNQVKVAPIQLASFRDIIKFDGINYIDHFLENDNVCQDALFNPFNGIKEKIFLFYEERQYIRPHENEVYEYFTENGYRTIQNAHPGILVSAMNYLTKEKLSWMGIPPSVSIELPVDRGFTYRDRLGRQSFFSVWCCGDTRILQLKPIEGKRGDGYYSAFLLCVKQ